MQSIVNSEVIRYYLAVLCKTASLYPPKLQVPWKAQNIINSNMYMIVHIPNILFWQSSGVFFPVVSKSDIQTAGTDPGFFLGGGTPLRNGVTNTNKPHMHFFSLNISCIKKPPVISGGWGVGCTPPAPSP